MYVLVHHQVHDPRSFWSLVDQVLDMPPGLTLHHTLSARDGTMATCLWEAESVDAVRDFLDPVLGTLSTNRYAAAENREGVVQPTQLATGAPT